MRSLRSGPEHHLLLQLVGTRARGLMPAGHVYAEQQFNLPVQEVPGGTMEEYISGTVDVQRDENLTTVSSTDLSVGFDTGSGLLISINHRGRELLQQPLVPNFWRAPTDNDFGNYMQDWAAIWEQAGRNRTLESLDVNTDNPCCAKIEAHYSFASDSGDPLADWVATYELTADGRVIVDNRFTRDPALPVMPRVGMNVELIRSLDQVEWFGRGPHENYSDRKESANVGRYQNTVSDHYVPYMRPQENGYKTDVRWLSLSDADSGLLIMADDLISFGVSHNRLIDFVPPVKIAITSEDGPGARANDERVNVHVNDVKPRDLISLDIDLGQMGVGGDDSWGKRTLQEYSLNESSYHYGFSLLPYVNKENELDAHIKN
jgi:beta-galactosidase